MKVSEMDSDKWLSEIGRFADIDATLQSAVGADRWTTRFRQRGEDVELTYHVVDGSVVERRGALQTRYGSHRGLLASQHFANLALLARLQRSTIHGESGGRETPVQSEIPMVGELDSSTGANGETSLLAKVDEWTAKPSDSGGVRALVIDGPAGIGKTYLIRALVRRRAENFGPNGRPLVLHVQSRGRQLTTLPDLLAGTLQTLRLSLTYDQVPVLARHGLIQIAIDGFDELADPSGYETAWHSLNDFIADIDTRGLLRRCPAKC